PTAAQKERQLHAPATSAPPLRFCPASRPLPCAACHTQSARPKPLAVPETDPPAPGAVALLPAGRLRHAQDRVPFPVSSRPVGPDAACAAPGNALSPHWPLHRRASLRCSPLARAAGARRG